MGIMVRMETSGPEPMAPTLNFMFKRPNRNYGRQFNGRIVPAIGSTSMVGKALSREIKKPGG